MSGIVQPVLTDKELERLVAWGEGVRSSGGCGFSWDNRDATLLTRMRNMKDAVACTGGKCSTLRGRDDV